MKLKVISAPEVAYLLRRELGPIRNWDDSLADMRRGRVVIHGCTLLPKCMGKYANAWRPMYAVPDILDFIRNVRAADCGAARHVSYQVKTAYMDPTDIRPWRLSKLPVALSTMVARCSAVGSAKPFTSSV